MSKYTTEVRTICEVAVGLDESVGYGSVNKVILDSIPKVFNFDFPLFDETYRNVLCSKILKHYYTREIGLETVGLWKLKLDTKLNEIMPYYNQLYESQLLKFNPLYEVDLTRDYTKTGDISKQDVENVKSVDSTLYSGNESDIGTVKDVGSNDSDKKYNDATVKDLSMTKDNTVKEKIDYSEKGTSVTDVKNTNSNTNDVESTKWNLFSDTPQGGISKIGIEGDNYLTTATKDTNNVTTKDNGKNDSNSNVSSSSTNGGTKDITGKDVTGGVDDIKSNGSELVKLNNNNTTSTDMRNTKNFNSNNELDRNLISNGTINNFDTYFERVKGKTSSTSYSKLLQEFRQTFLNIDKMIIDELQDLFMLVW